MSISRFLAILRPFAFIVGSALLLAGCQSNIPKAMTPVPAILLTKMKVLGMDETAPIFIRIFKEESQLEVWKQKQNGEYALLTTYAICRWSGELGPKIQEGDYQAPEGFYTVTPSQMNPNSAYYLSFNIGYPNAFDRSLGRTGGNLMVHGACSSAGCYSMTDAQAAEIFALARDSFKGGQTSFQVHAFPFQMTPENMAKHHANKHFGFWQMLKAGYDHFEATRRIPKVDVCGRHYVFDADSGGLPFVANAACPPFSTPSVIATAVARKQASDDAEFRSLVARADPAAGAVTLAWDGVSSGSLPRASSTGVASLIATDRTTVGATAPAGARTLANADPTGTPLPRPNPRDGGTQTLSAPSGAKAAATAQATEPAPSMLQRFKSYFTP